jgi:hypothetical protein
MTACELTTMALLLGGILRILTFQRRGKHHRPAAAIVAWLLVTTLATLFMNVATGRANLDAIGWPIVALLTLLNTALFIVRGNVSQLLQLLREAHHAATR